MVVNYQVTDTKIRRVSVQVATVDEMVESFGNERGVNSDAVCLLHTVWVREEKENVGEEKT